MEENDLLITKSGLEKLKKEYKLLTERKRVEVAEKIKSAREFGDISENSEYDAAREEQAFVEGRISELEEILKKAKVSDTTKEKGGFVTIGSQVCVHLEGEEQTFEIVGSPEADPSQNKISHDSPLGKALMGRKVGDRIEIEAPVGILNYTILAVS